MGRIRVLDDALINRIAAGEVVERPASVVKELLENALDAGARSIDVQCEAGGRRRIVVRDDGSGMDRDDAVLSLERHATSKLRGVEQLSAIGTLGFRGEALSSIAAVSRFLLRTSIGEGSGTEIEVQGGRIRAVREAGLPRGTAVEVAALFFNVPGRRKFLRTEATELGHIARLVTRYALAYPQIRFRLRHGERDLLAAEPAPDRDERVAQIYGREFSRKLQPFEHGEPGLRIHGLAGRPAEALPRRDGQHLFVNGRAVQDRTLSHAVAEAYGNTVPKGRHPAVFLFIEIEPGGVDVNVHPQKLEVRFRRPGWIHDAVRDTLQRALSGRAAVPHLADLRPPERPAGAGTGVAQAVARYVERAGRVELREPGAAYPGPSAAGPAPSPESVAPARRATPLLDREAADGEAVRSQAVPLAQFRDSYIVAQDDGGLILVDQHAAHERVLFERLLAEAEQNRVEVQRLLFPVTLELSAAERLTLEAEAAEFRRLGFLIEPFGGNSVRVDGVPAVTAEVEPRTLIAELLGEAARTRAAASGASELRHKLVTSAACQAAIKIHHPLTQAGMQQLLDDLFRTTNPTTCPHGRPLLFRLSEEEIERAFRRR